MVSCVWQLRIGLIILEATALLPKVVVAVTQMLCVGRPRKFILSRSTKRVSGCPSKS